jgi:hypothetical protein
MADDQVFSVFIDDLARDGIHLSDGGDLSKEMSEKVTGAIAEFPEIGGNGTIGKSINGKYYPAAEMAARFVAQLADLLNMHSGKVTGAAEVFNGVNEQATTEATGSGRKG